MVLDKDKNIFIMERNMKPTNEIEKYKLKVVAQISSGEEITSALVGSINIQEAHSGDRQASREDVADSQEAPRFGTDEEAYEIPMRKRGK